jgi:outer membrane murein-binding lipoprotein Lpp
MNKFLIGAALAATLVLSGCGDDEEEKQKARIAANAALLTAQQEKITETVPQIAQLTARLNSLQEELAASEATIAEKNAAEARLAKLQAESTELQSALTRIEEFQARAKLVNPEAGDFLSIKPAYPDGEISSSRRFVDPGFNAVVYYYSGGQALTRLSDLSPSASTRMQACIDGQGCLVPTIEAIWEMRFLRRIIDWDAGLIVYGAYGDDTTFTIYPFEHFGEEFAARMHAEANELRTQQTSQ